MNGPGHLQRHRSPGKWKTGLTAGRFLKTLMIENMAGGQMAGTIFRPLQKGFFF